MLQLFSLVTAALQSEIQKSAKQDTLIANLSERVNRLTASLTIEITKNAKSILS